MELISQRVARGEPVRPARPAKKKRAPQGSMRGKDDDKGEPYEREERKEEGRSQSKPRQEFDWRGLGAKAHAMQRWAGQNGLLGSKNKVLPTIFKWLKHC